MHPPKSKRFITNINAEMFPFDISISFAAAFAVPPVAIRSSIINTESFSSIESRGFVFASAVSYILKKPFIMLRKKK